MRWDLIDKFEVLKKGSYGRGIKKFTGQEDFFRENFPRNPRVPEPLFVEMIAQTGGVLFGLGLDFKKEVILAKITEAKFTRPVAPPCEFVVEVTIEDEREEGAWITGTVKLKNEIVAEASIMLVTMDSLEEKQKIVFNDDFLKLFDVYNVAKASEGVTC
jgi:3-hydroxymyristoyl/3-hydroxydecanoyl-(acyl carrier protein) dehydratase